MSANTPMNRPVPPPRRPLPQFPTAKVVVETPQKEPVERELPKGLDRNFLNTLDQTFTNKERERKVEGRSVTMPRQISDGNQSFESLDGLTIKDKKKLSHRRTASTGTPKDRAKLKLMDGVEGKKRLSTNPGKKLFASSTPKKKIEIKMKENETESLTTTGGTTQKDKGVLVKDKEKFAEFLLQSALVLLGYETDSVTKIIEHVKTNYSPNESNYGESYDKTLKALQRRILEFNGSQVEHVCATKIQAAFRRWRIRKVVKPIFS